MHSYNSKIISITHVPSQTYIEKSTWWAPFAVSVSHVSVYSNSMKTYMYESHRNNHNDSKSDLSMNYSKPFYVKTMQ